MHKNESVYFENLDGLRFVSFLFVFFFHSFHTEFEYIRTAPVYSFIKKDIVGNGNLGVNFFFALSGFLITYLLLRENSLNGRIDVVSFWKRRILRIWPLFYFCVAFGFLVFPLLKSFFGQIPNETARPLYYLTFLNNFDFIARGLPDASVLGTLWSIAVEEQFYFIWPLVLVWLRPRHYPYFFGFVILISICFRAVYDNPAYHEYHTLSCMGDMAMGALGAWAVQFERVKSALASLSKLAILGLYSALLIIFLLRTEIFSMNLTMRVMERPLIAFLFLLVILEQNYSRRSFFKVGSSSVMTRLGRITYGLYCLHFIGILMATTLTRYFHWNTYLWQVLILETGIAMFLTLVIATLSYRYFESPFLRLKATLSRIRVADPGIN